MIIKSKKYESSYWISGAFSLAPFFLLLILLESKESTGVNELVALSIFLFLTLLGFVLFLFFQEFIFLKVYKTLEECPFESCLSKVKSLENRDVLENNLNRNIVSLTFCCDDCNKKWIKEVYFHRFRSLDKNNYDFLDNKKTIFYKRK